MSKTTKIDSDFAILDVKKGRHKLAKRIKSKLNPQHERVPIILHGFIDLQHGSDDGVSTEFQVDVASCYEGKIDKDLLFSQINRLLFEEGQALDIPSRGAVKLHHDPLKTSDKLVGLFMRILLKGT